MPRNGSGTYSRVAGTPYVFGTIIDQDVVNDEMDDIATALTASIAKDGQTTPTANLPMGTFKHTGVGTASSLTDYARADQIQNQGLVYLTSPAGTNTITATATPTPSAYAAGQAFEFIPAATNTGATTINISSLGAKNIFFNGAACAGGELVIGVPTRIIYDGTQFNILGPTLPATQAQMEAATSSSVYVPPSRLKNSPNAIQCRGKADSAGNLSAGVNVTSLTDVGTGILTVTIDTDISSGDYAISPGILQGTAGTSYTVKVSAQAAGSFTLRCYANADPADLLADPDAYFWIVGGDL